MGRSFRIVVKDVRINVSERIFTDGTRLYGLKCRERFCPHQCAMSIMMPAGLYSVKLEEVVEKCFLQCKRLEKMAKETEKLDGRISLMSVVNRSGV